MCMGMWETRPRIGWIRGGWHKQYLIQILAQLPLLITMVICLDNFLLEIILTVGVKARSRLALIQLVNRFLIQEVEVIDCQVRVLISFQSMVYWEDQRE